MCVLRTVQHLLNWMRNHKAIMFILKILNLWVTLPSGLRRETRADFYREDLSDNSTAGDQAARDGTRPYR